MIQTKLTECIGQDFYDLYHNIKDGDYTHYWLKGGRGSLKSSFISIMCVMEIIRDKNANAIIIRKVGTTLRGSVFEQIKWAIYKLGVQDYFYIPKEKLEITYKPTGQKIVFRGLDNATKIQSIKIATGYFKFIWYEELHEFNGMEEIRKTNQSLIRGGEYDNYICMYSYNPPRSLANWVNQESLQKASNRLVHHSCYLNAPKEWLGDEFIIEAEELKKYNEKAYNHEYLGKSVGYGAEIFENVVVRELTEKDYEQFTDVRNGLDFGFTVDPAHYTRLHYDRKRRRIYIFDEVHSIKMSNSMIKEEVSKRNKNNDVVIADSAEPRTISELNGLGLNITACTKGADSVRYGINFLQELFEIIIDKNACPNTVREFTTYEYPRDKRGNIINRFPDKDNHSIDAVRYALDLDINKSSTWNW